MFKQHFIYYIRYVSKEKYKITNESQPRAFGHTLQANRVVKLNIVLCICNVYRYIQCLLRIEFDAVSFNNVKNIYFFEKTNVSMAGVCYIYILIHIISL